MAIDTNSKYYKSMLDKGYTASEIQQMYNDVAAGKNAKDVVNSMNAQKAANKSTTTTTSTTSTPKTSSNYQTITYNGQVSGNTSGTSNMNSMSQSKAVDNSRNFQVGTGDVAEMPQQPKAQSVATSSTNVDKLAKAWNGLDYETQQKKLNAISGLKDALASKGITSKTAPTTTTTTTTTPKKTAAAQTPKQDQWDYQDNSQARMNQIADNLDKYRITNPELFDDMSAFYNFFIKDKGRSQDQIDFLWDYYDRMQKYGKYDSMSPDAIGKGIADGTIPQEYLNYIKSTDINRYNEILGYKKDAEDTIKNEGYLSDAASMAGIEGWESEPSSIKYAKWNEIWMDEDDNGIDDRREHYASEEEQGYQKQIADLNAANLDIDNTVKHTYEDYVEKYPGATKATLMAMAQDTNAKLLREKENNLVELTRLQGYVGYMQEERFEMNKAGADSIAQLQKNLGLYYDYSPEGMAELAQAKYAATNITLDQADSGNETQKQMALQNVLDGYYEKYGDIIQRSEQQVINDVIAYAKKNGVGLAQALQENFVKPLQEKPQFKAMNMQGVDTGISWTKIGEDAEGNDIYGFVDTMNKTVTPYGAYGGTSTTTTTKTYTTQEISSDRDKRVDAMRDIANQYNNIGDMAEAIAYNMEGIGDGNLECGKYVNDYINAVTGTKGGYGNSIASKTALAKNKNWSDIQPGDIVVFDYNKNTPQWVLNSPQKNDLLKYGHVGIVTGVNEDGSINMSHTNGGVVQNTVVKPGSSFYNSFVGSQHISPSGSLGKGYNEERTNEYLAFINAAGNPESQKKIANGLGLTVEQMREQSNRYSWQQTAVTYFDMLGRINNILKSMDEGTLPGFYARKDAMSSSWYSGLSTFNQGVSDWKADNDKIVDTLSLDSLINLKGRGATFGALSDSEREAIGRYATALGSPMSDDKYKYELEQLRKNLIEASHGYLGDLSSYGQNQSYDWSAGIG